jgi:hypothetical protein
MTPRSLIGTAAFLAFSLGASGASMEAADFGTPPSGEIPILFNDHTVYAKPDVLKERRVLAALVRNGEMYLPLRAMFEQMGATVSLSADGQTVTAAKPGASVSVTLGRPEVIINGESRPLDVPPILYKGRVLVPVRVISEALGAYVQWLQGRQVVVVRYIPFVEVTAPPTIAPTAPPTIAPTAPPTVAPVAPPIVVAPPMPVATPPPTPVPTEASYTGFAQAAYSTPQNFNEFVAGGYCDTYILNAAYAPQNVPIALKADFRQDSYDTSRNGVDAVGNHYTQFATIDGGSAYAPAFLARQKSFDARAEYRVAAPRIYVGVGYLHISNNYGYPNLTAFGAGIEKLPDLRNGLSLYGSAFYYPNASGNYTVTSVGSVNLGTVYQQQYNIVKYDIGAALVVAHSPLYLFGGYAGDRYTAIKNAPIGQSHTGPYIGLGVKL